MIKQHRAISFMLATILTAIVVNSSGPAYSGLSGKNNSLAYADQGSFGTISKISTGLVAQDSLTNNTSVNTSYWTMNGDAVAMNAPHSFSEDSEGLHIGIQAASSGQWAGFYAMTPKTDARLFHAVLSIPFKTVQDHWWDTGMYVQTSGSMVNYVTCAAVVDHTHVTWEVMSTKGNTNSATEFNVLWKDTSANQPYTRDCTIVTNGSNSLQVYLDNQLVYSGNSLDLQMPAPFNAYLEVQASTTSEKLFGTYTDFYATTSQDITLSGAPVAGRVELVDSAGNILASEKVGSDGTASLDIGRYHMPLAASIKAYNPSGRLVASSDVASLWGGDRYSTIIDSKNNNKDDKAQASNNNDNHDNKKIAQSLAKAAKKDARDAEKTIKLAAHQDKKKQDSNVNNVISDVVLKDNVKELVKGMK